MLTEPTIRMLILDTVSILLEHHSRLCRADSENGLENEERLFDVPIRMVSDINQQVSMRVCRCGVRVKVRVRVRVCWWGVSVLVWRGCNSECVSFSIR